MRILLVTPSYWPAVRYGGTITSVRNLSEGLAAKGHHVEIFTTTVDGDDTLEVPVGVPVSRGGVLVTYFSVPLVRRFYFSPAMARAMARRIDEFDIVTIHSVFLWPTIAGAWAANKHQVPYVLFPHGMLVKELIAAKTRVLKQIWLWMFGRGLFERACAIRVTSALEQAELLRFGWRSPPVLMLPNPVADPPAPPRDGPSADIALLMARQPLILYFGRLSWKKGLDCLLYSLAHAACGHLAIVGPDDEGITPRLHALAASLGMSDRVSILPRMVTGADTEHLYGAAKLFALASLNENFGNTVVEAMRRAVPVVVTPEVGASDVVGLAGGGLIVERDPRALGEAIDQLLANEPRREALGRAGASYASRQLSIAVITDQFEREFLKLAR